MRPALQGAYAQAVELLAQQHAEHKDCEQLFETMVESAFLSTAKYLEAVSKSTPAPGVHGKAGFQQAIFLKNYCEMLDRLPRYPTTRPTPSPSWAQPWSKTLTTTDPVPLRKQAEEALVHVQKNYGLVEFNKSFLGKLANRSCSSCVTSRSASPSPSSPARTPKATSSS